MRSRKLLAAFSDERLVAQLRLGSEAAFEVLYDRHHRGVLSYCRHMLGSLHEAEDALQQSFVSAHQGIVTSTKPIAFKAWLYTIARNRCLSMLRARRERPSDELELLSTVGLSEEVEDRADLKELMGDMHELPGDQRAALVLSELGDLSHAEVAEVIGCEAAKVKSLVFQARSGLIERRQARETPCEEIREQLATLRGGSLRRGPLRRHLKACPGCSEFRAQVKHQRQMLAIVLPVIPTIGLRESALAAAGVGSGSAATGVTAAGGIAAATAVKAGAAKIAIVAIAAGGAAVGGGVAVERTLRDDPIPIAPATETAPAGSADDADAAPSGAAERIRDANARDKRGPGVNGEPGENGKPRNQDGRDFARDRGNGRHLGLDKTPPGQSKTPPGQAKTKPGRANGAAPGQTRTPPGQVKTPSGWPDTAPGRSREPIGQTREPRTRTQPTKPETPAKPVTPQTPELPQQTGKTKPVKPLPATPVTPPGKSH